MLNDLIWALFIYPFYFLRLIVIELNTLRKTPKLLRIQLYIWLYYFFFYPFFRQIYEKIKTKQDVSELVYGETPLASFQKILKALPNPITSQDRFVDLGCGKGMLTLYMAEIYKIQSTGYDIIPTFIKKATQIATTHQIHNTQFIQKSILDANLSQATIVYLAWTCLSHETRTQLTQKLANELPTGAVVITTTYPITDPRITPFKTLTLDFSWSSGTATLHRFTQSNSQIHS